MNEIYQILSKHFLNENSKEEELLINEFKRNNKAEYEILKKLWENGKNIEIIDFDSEKAWAKIQENFKQKEKKNTKVIWLNTKLKQIAAVAAILVIGVFSAYYFIHTSQSFELFSTVNIVQTTAIHTERGKTVTLNDGSKVWLNRNATLTYPEEFKGDKRPVKLSGEAFFEVAKNAEKPFIITTENAEIKVLGTSFNINNNTNTTKVTVATGTVQVTNADKSKQIIITKGFSAEVSGKKINKFATLNPNFQAWRTGKFVFKNTKITDVITELNKFYKRQLRINTSTENNCLLNADFDNTKLEEIVEIIKLTCNVDISIENSNSENKKTAKQP